MIINSKLPKYTKVPLLIVAGFFFISMLYIAQGIILPLLYAIIVSVLLSPPVNYLVRKKVNRALAISIVLLTLIIIASGLMALIMSQTQLLRQAWPELSVKFHSLLSDAVAWTSSCFDISIDKIYQSLSDEQAELMKGKNSAIGITLTTMGGILAGAILTPVYIFMILYYQPHLLDFIHKLFDADNDRKVSEILHEIKTIIQSYLRGLFVEFVIISVMNSIGLLMLGIKYAVIFGIAAAILNVIPLIGGVIGIALFVVIALIAKSPIYVLYVIIVYSVIQFIDNHYIIPKIVGAKVKLNALVCVVAVIAADALWGIPGMFLAIPLTAMVKLILDRIDALKPWGFLLGDTVSDHTKPKFGYAFKQYINHFFIKNTNEHKH
jgi:predicted PurR-regulated permease PerM